MDKKLFVYLYFLALVFAQVTAILALPIQGLTISNTILLVLFVALIFSFGLNYEKYLLLIFIYIYLFLYLASQLTILIADSTSSPLVPMVDNTGLIEAFKKSHFTQFLYLIPGLTLFLLTRRYWSPSAINYFFVGQALIASIGILEVVYNSATGSTFAFLINRQFDSGEGSGSLVQYSFGMLRLKSLTGEPSMYAYAVLPGFILALGCRRFFLAGLIALSLLMTYTSTFFIGIFAYFFIISVRLTFQTLKKSAFDKKFFTLLFFDFLLVFVFVLFFDYFNNYFIDPLIKKITMQNVSGQQRLSWAIEGLDFIFSSKYILFGVGFGTFRSTDMLTTLLLNIGLIGTALWYLFLMFSIRESYKKRMYSVADAIFISLITSTISVPEFSYLSLWFLLGAAFSKNALHGSRYEKMVSESRS